MKSKGTIITARNLKKEYRMGEVTVNALNDASFAIEEGEFVVILGPSGSGKSTTLNMIGGIDTLSGGELLYYDMPVSGMSKSRLVEYRRDHIGFVFQFYNLIPNLNVLENVKLSAEMSKSPLNPEELVEKVGLSARKTYYPAKLSGGQQQRVAIARALCKNPDILLCDEPTGALDIKTGVEILKLLHDFNREYEKTVIIVTHNADIALVADHVLRFRDGRIESDVVNEKPELIDEVSW